MPSAARGRLPPVGLAATGPRAGRGAGALAALRGFRARSLPTGTRLPDHWGYCAGLRAAPRLLARARTLSSHNHLLGTYCVPGPQ